MHAEVDNGRQRDSRSSGGRAGGRRQPQRRTALRSSAVERATRRCGRPIALTGRQHAHGGPQRRPGGRGGRARRDRTPATGSCAPLQRVARLPGRARRRHATAGGQHGGWLATAAEPNRERREAGTRKQDGADKVGKKDWTHRQRPAASLAAHSATHACVCGLNCAARAACLNFSWQAGVLVLRLFLPLWAPGAATHTIKTCSWLHCRSQTAPYRPGSAAVHLSVFFFLSLTLPRSAAALAGSRHAVEAAVPSLPLAGA
jgi:hypothetical protein